MSGCGDGIHSTSEDLFGKVIGCAYSMSSGPRREGELGRYTLAVAGLCEGPCSIDRPLAAGASIDVRVDETRSDARVPATATLVSSDPDVVTVVDPRFDVGQECDDERLRAVLSANGAGHATLELRDGATVLDRFTVEVREGSTLGIEAYSTQLEPIPATDETTPATSFEGPCGVSVRLVARDASGTPFLDAPDATWTIVQPDGTSTVFDSPIPWAVLPSAGAGTYHVHADFDGTQYEASIEMTH